MKALVVEGILERLSAGAWDGTFNVHEFVDIAGKRLSKVVWTQFMTGFLQESMGKKGIVWLDLIATVLLMKPLIQIL